MGRSSSSCLHVVGDSNFDAFSAFSKKTNGPFSHQVNCFPAQPGSKRPVPLRGASAVLRMQGGGFEKSWKAGCLCRHAAKLVKNRVLQQFGGGCGYA